MTLYVLNPFIYNIGKWQNILWKSCGVHTSGFLKYAWLFFNIINEMVKNLSGSITLQTIIEMDIGQTQNFRGHSFGAFVKFPQELTFLIAWYTHIRIRG